MPIEYGDVAWPPAECAAPDRLYREWGAWYSGDPKELQAVYADGLPGSFLSGLADNRHPLAHSAQLSGGMVGRLARFWWGRPTSAEQPAAKIHLPAAGDLSMYAADLLFGAPPDITVGDPQPVTVTLPDGTTETGTEPHPATAWWDSIAEAVGWDSRLLEAAEVGSAYGGVYLRASVMTPDAGGFVPVEAPIVEAIPADAAIPTWRNGFLVAVTFWRELERAKKKMGGTSVWRHLERHEPGAVYHALYLGSEDKLGVPVPLTMRPETANYAEVAATGATGLAVEYMPNMRPHRLIRGSNLGRSDYSGSEPLMDALDETWSSWMRDIRLAKGRVVAPEAYLESNGPGQGASFDAEREVWAGINTMPKLDGSSGLTIVQFAIRVAEHRDTAAAALRQIWRTAGYATGENGEENEAQASATATQVVARGARTASTRKRKIGYWKPGLVRIVRSMMQMGQHAGYAPKGVTIDPAMPVSVEFPPAYAPDAEGVARTLQLLAQANAVSTRVKVEMVHPEWGETEVAAEVASIQGALAPPAQPTFD